ncbi:MAG: hypothetical protein ACTHJ8_12730 [Mucilaginibacter sp.]
MEQENSEFEIKSFTKVYVEGEDKTLWVKLKPKLINLMTELLEAKINYNTGGTTREELKRVTANVIEFANAKLEKASIENENLLAEIELKLATKQKCQAETRKINAEAEKIEIENIEKKLKLALGLAKGLFHSTKDDEIIIFIKSFEELCYIPQGDKLTGT